MNRSWKLQLRVAGLNPGPFWALLPILLMALSWPLAARAQVSADWTASSPGATGAALALDAGNNSLVLGSVPGGSMVLGKIGPAGVALWQRPIAGTGTLSRGTGVVVDAAGNAVVTGMVLDASVTPQGALVAKVDPSGALLWQDVAAGLYNLAWRAVVDPAGNVYALSRITRPNTGTAVVTDMTLTKFSPTGVRQWSRTYGARFAVEDALIVTSAGHVVVAGGAELGGTVLAAFDAAGTTLWSTLVPGNNGMGLAAGRTGEFYAVGGAGLGFQVMKFDAAFNLLWNNSYPARGPALRAAVDSLGNVLVSGGVDTNTGLLTVVLYDWLTIKLSPAGALLWSNPYGLPTWSNDIPAALALGADDAVYVTGQGAVQMTDAAGNLFLRGSTATVKYTAAGAQAWVANTAQASRGLDVKVSTDGGVMVVADTPQTLLRYPQTGLPNQPPTAMASASTSAGPAPLTVAFSSAGSGDADGRIASYAWSFGDGQMSTAANPSHTYAAGTYSAQLTVTDNLGATRSAAPITITANPVVLAPARPRSLTLAQAAVAEGGSTTATVTVSTAAGVTLTLSSSNPAVAGVPAQLVIPAGATRGTFTIVTSAVRKDTKVTIRASANGSSASATLTVRNR